MPRRKCPKSWGLRPIKQQFATLFGELQRRIWEENQQFNVIELNIANALWTQEGFPFAGLSHDALQPIPSQHQAKADFITNAAGVTQTINNWVAQKTQNKIQDILPPGSINGSTRLVLANAILLSWASGPTPFRRSNTVDPAPFHLSKYPIRRRRPCHASAVLLWQPGEPAKLVWHIV